MGRALKSIPRERVVIATKAQIHRNDEWYPPERVVTSLDNSLRAMGIDHVDVFNLHGVESDEYDYARNTIAPVLLEQKAKGKIRHIGLTENPITDFTNDMLKRALADPVWEVFMVGFHMMHQGARQNVFPITRENGVGTLLMFAVRSIFADPPRIAREMRALAEQGLVDQSLGETDDPLGFLGSRGRRCDHDRGGLSLCAARAGRRRGAVRHRRCGASARQYRGHQQAAVAGGGPGEAAKTVRASGSGRRARRPSGAGAVRLLLFGRCPRLEMW